MPMSTSNSTSAVHTTDNNIRYFLKDVYQKTNPRNVFSVFVTGGGCTALEWLFTTSSASKSLMDGGVVYSHSALKELVFDRINANNGLNSTALGSACSSSTALLMSESSWRRANKYLLEETKDFNDLRNVNLFGVSCTAALISDNPKVIDTSCVV